MEQKEKKARPPLVLNSILNEAVDEDLRPILKQICNMIGQLTECTAAVLDSIAKLSAEKENLESRMDEVKTLLNETPSKLKTVLDGLAKQPIMLLIKKAEFDKVANQIQSGFDDTTKILATAHEEQMQLLTSHQETILDKIRNVKNVLVVSGKLYWVFMTLCAIGASFIVSAVTCLIGFLFFD